MKAHMGQAMLQPPKDLLLKHLEERNSTLGPLGTWCSGVATSAPSRSAWRRLLGAPFLEGGRLGFLCPLQNPLTLYQREILMDDFSIMFSLHKKCAVFLPFDEV